MYTKLTRDDIGGLLAEHERVMYGTAFRILGNSEDAEDVVQQTSLEAWERNGYDPTRKASPKTWLLMKTRTRAIDLYRKKRTSSKHLGHPVLIDGDSGIDVDGPLASNESGEDSVFHAERVGAIRQALEELPPEQRLVIQGSYFEGMSHAEMAKAYSIPVGTVKTRMSLGLKKLSRALGPQYAELL